jgi:hypothetical protein
MIVARSGAFGVGPPVVEYLFWSGALVLLGLLVAADHIRSRFRHTARSRRLLGGLAAACYAASVGLVEALVRPGRWAFALLWALLVWLPLYTLAALVAVERWRRRKLSGFDRAIRELRREAVRRRDALDRLTWEIRDLERHGGRRDAPPQPDDGGPWRRRIEAWQTAGGLARVRALKVAEWRAEVEGLDEAGLRERERQLEAALSGADAERREQLEVQLALVRLARPPGPAAAPPEPEPEDELAAALRRRSDEERELTRVQEELARRQRERAAFVRQKIVLD